jgi:hypothetical protein
VQGIFAFFMRVWFGKIIKGKNTLHSMGKKQVLSAVGENH